MSQTIIFGTDASVTFVAGAGALFNGFTFNATQGVASAIGFGMAAPKKRGTIKEYSGTVSGFTTSGTTSDQPGTAAMNRTGNSMTLTFLTGCTMAGTAILDGLGLGVQYTANATSTYSFQFDLTPTETWITS